MMYEKIKLWAIIAIGVAITWITNEWGLWYVTLIWGFIAAIALPTRKGVLAGLIVGLGGWMLPLVCQSTRLPIGKSASVIAEAVGLNANAAPFIVALTGVWGTVLAISGVWLGSSLTNILQRSTVAQHVPLLDSSVSLTKHES